MTYEKKNIGYMSFLVVLFLVSISQGWGDITQYPNENITVIDSTPDLGASYVVGNALDGNLATEYVTTNTVPGIDTFVTFDLGAVVPVGGFKFYNRNDLELVTEFGLLLYNDPNDPNEIIENVTVPAEAGSSAYVEFAPFDARYIKWYVTGYQGHPSGPFDVPGAAEFEVYVDGDVNLVNISPDSALLLSPQVWTPKQYKAWIYVTKQSAHQLQ